MVAAIDQLAFPDDSHRHAIVGTTGSGKTTFGLWCLSRRSYDAMPWIILDAKHDSVIARIPRLTQIRVDQKPPVRRGLYVARPTVAEFDDGVVSAFLYDIWRNEHTGIFIDEGYAFNRFDKALKTVLTQGRSKHIPVISLSQKPSWVSPFLFSESEFKSVFYLDQPADIERTMAWLPARDPNTGARIAPDLLADHESYWCHRRKQFARLGPCPPEAEIFETFDQRVPVRSFI